MYSRIEFIISVCILVILSVACTSTGQSVQSNSLVSSTATIDPLPSDTPVPTATSLPDVLATMPIFGERDVALTAGTNAFQITHIYQLDHIGDTQPNDGSIFLVLEGRLFNFGETPQDFFRTNFEIEVIDNVELLPNLDLMDELKKEQYPDRDYPGRSSIHINTLTLAAKAWHEIFVVYEVPSNTESFDVIFQPENLRIPTVVTVWILQVGDNLRFYKAAEEDISNYSIDFDFNNTQVEIEELIDSEIIEVDNCFGTSEISRTQTFEEQIISSYSLGEAATDIGGMALNSAMRLGSQMLQLNPITATLLATDFGNFHNVNPGESITVTRTENLSAAPGTLTRFQLSWYRVTVQGTMQLKIGGDNYYIPFTLVNRLRSDLESLPQGECDE